MYRCKTEGNVYDLAPLGFVNEEGGTTHVTTQNEHLGSLQSKGEGHWFNDTFLEFDCVEQFPFDQHHLAALVADKDRYLFLISGMLGEDWVNPAASGVTYAATRQVYEFLGLADHVCLCEHLQGHAVLLSDMVKLLDYCDVMLYGEDEQDVKTDFATIRTSVFWEEQNLDKEVYEAFLR
jgi:endo-1,4-beta-xylanase